MGLAASRGNSFAVLGYLVFYALAWTAVSFWLDPAVPRDAVEALSWANNAGFHSPKNPYVVGGAMAIGQWLEPFLSIRLYWYLVHFIGVAAGMLGVWLLGRRLFGHDAVALLAMMSLNLAGIVNVDVLPYNDNYLLVALWPYLFLFFVKAAFDRPVHWISFALVAGLATMSKYSTVVFLPFMLLYLLRVPAARKAFRSPAFYLAGLLFLAVTAPNVVWLARHDWAAVNWVESEIAPGFNFHALIAFLSVFYPALLLFLALVPLGAKRALPDSPEKQAVLFAFAAPLLAILAYFSFHRGARLAEWLQPFAMLTPVALLSVLDLGQVRPLRRMAIALAAVAAIVCGAYALVLRFDVQGAGSKFKYIRDVGADLNAAWQEKYHRPLKYVGGGYLAQWLTFYAPDRPRITTRWSAERRPNVYNAQIETEDILRDGALFLSDRGISCVQTNFEQVLSEFPGVVLDDKREYSYWDDQGRRITLCLGFAPPRSK